MHNHRFTFVTSLCAPPYASLTSNKVNGVALSPMQSHPGRTAGAKKMESSDAPCYMCIEKMHVVVVHFWNENVAEQGGWDFHFSRT